MGRGRGKGKKQSVASGLEDVGSGEEEKIPTSKRRGRPTKPLKDDVVDEEEDLEKREDEGKEYSNDESGRKKRRPIKGKDAESIKEENGAGPNISMSDSATFVGFRQNGSRRKNKPRRAAEVGVECN